MNRIARIPRTLQVVSNCWLRAEEALRKELRENNPSSGEESITYTFYGKLVVELRAASQQRLIAQAFLADLTVEFHELAGKQELAQIANGLLADVTRHERKTEKNTGGDLGLLIIRPQAQFSGSLISVNDYRRGLLCQAKLRNTFGKWGTFTPRQKAILPQRLSYLGLLLYQYMDRAQHALDAFQWQLCNSVAFTEVEGWLKNDTFPSRVGSAEIIQCLGNGKIGTGDNKTIGEVICPAGNPSFVIRIYWPRGNPPGVKIEVLSKHEVKQTATRSYVQMTEEPLASGDEKVFA